MKMIALSVALDIASRIALAQGSADPAALPGSCGLLAPSDRLACRDIQMQVQPAADGPADWIISETTSPVNYSPIVTATVWSRDATGGSAMQLSVHCRGGRTEMVIAGAAIVTGSDYSLSYRVNEGQAVQSSAGAPSFGTGAAFRGDIVALLLSLPDAGGIAIRLAPRNGQALDGQFSLKGVKAARERVAAACKWPHAVARPQNQ